VENSKEKRVKGGKKMKKKWVQDVTTDSTSPPEGIFSKDAETIARVMARRDVSPKGIGSAIRMVQYFINRAGCGLSKSRKKELEKAKKILQEKMKK
jgi:tRNA(adenine34) deaminase